MKCSLFTLCLFVTLATFVHAAPMDKEPEGEMCALFIVPCPKTCRDSCIYPKNVPCPFTHTPVCPK